VYRLRKRVEIDSSHYLPAHPGKCRRLHGHRWVFEVEVTAEDVDETTGMVVDFGDLAAPIKALDHRVINELDPFTRIPPTAENLAKWAVEEVWGLAPTALSVTVTVWETPSSSVSWTKRRDDR